MVDRADILRQAIAKALSNGYGSDLLIRTFPLKSVPWEEVIETKYYRAVIFSHDFARCFWGDEEVNKVNGETKSYFIKRWKNPYAPNPLRVWKDDGYSLIPIPAWQYHLQIMVLEEDPISYLAKFL